MAIARPVLQVRALFLIADEQHRTGVRRVVITVSAPSTNP